MAMAVEALQLGVDVAKAELVLCQGWDEQLVTLVNERRAIRRYLKGLPGPVALAVEATNSFHLALVEEAHALGHTVYVVDGYRLSNYRKGVGGRAKTDASDARLLLRYLRREQAELRPWSPPPAGYHQLIRLLRRRAGLIEVRVALSQSFQELPELKAAVRGVLRQLARLDLLIQQRLRQALVEQGWAAAAQRCQAIEGIGPLTAAGLVTVFHRGAFRSSDAFIAFLGLDVRVRDSGQFTGRRKLTKQGDPELRRLLHNAAMAACRSATWRPFYQRYRDRGLSTTQSLVILARKLARVAFALLKNQSTYQPRTSSMA